MNIGNFIKKAREKKGLSINQLALYSNVSAAHISRIERGLREPSPDILKKISTTLKIPYEELMKVAGYLEDKGNNLPESIEMCHAFAERLKQLRNEKGLLQRELAEHLKLSRVAITQYENGNRVPDQDIINKIADFFGVSLDYLMGKTDIRNPYDEFLAQAKEKYGPRGKKQAEELLENVRSLFDGGELPDEDKDEFFRAITEIYFESKEKNKKYTPKKYRKNRKELNNNEQ